MKAITVVGIDPGLERVGYGVLGGAHHPAAAAAAAPSAPAYGCIETARGLPAAERIREVYDAVSAVLDEHRPDWVAVEQRDLLETVNQPSGDPSARSRCRLGETIYAPCIEIGTE